MVKGEGHKDQIQTAFGSRRRWILLFSRNCL